MVGSSGLTNPTPLVLTEVLHRYGVGREQGVQPRSPPGPLRLSVKYIKAGFKGLEQTTSGFRGPRTTTLVRPKPERAWGILLILSQLRIRELG
jgi:hypothetical protein